MKFICKKCGSTDYKIIEKSNGNGIATGLYCAKCGQWQKWLNKQEKVLFAEDMNSTAEVDALKRDVENLTRTLEEVNEEYRALRAENAELKARLEKAVELPIGLGTPIYYLQYFCDYKKCSDITQQFCCGCPEMIEREWQNEKYVICQKPFELKDFQKIGKKYFLTSAGAEKRLKELQGEKK